MKEKILREIRKASFSKIPDLKEYKEILDVVRQYRSHSFLANSNGFIPYTYLVNYVCNVSEHYFKKPINQIKILDWGAGKGHVSYLFKKKGADKLVSCDIDESRIDSTFGQETPIIQKFNIDIVRLKHEYLLPFEDNEFDVVLSFGVLEHVSKELESLKELNRILKYNGLFFCFNLPYWLSYTQRISHLLGNYYHDRLYSKHTVKTLLKQTNFDLLDIWLRGLFPKNSVNSKHYKLYEKTDQLITNNTFLKFFCTSLEFIAVKK